MVLSQDSVNMDAKLKDVFQEKGIMSCELRLRGCTGNLFLTPAHRHKRIWYKGNPELLWDYSQVILSCLNCHNVIEYNRELTEEMFNKLR